MQVKNEVFCIAFLECLYQTLCSKKLRYCANYLT